MKNKKHYDFRKLILQRTKEICRQKNIDFDLFYDLLDESNTNFPFEVENMDELVGKTKEVLLEKVDEPEIDIVIFISYKLGIPTHKFFESELFR